MSTAALSETWTSQGHDMDRDRMTLCWRDLSFWVTVKHRKLFGRTKTQRIQLLNKVSGLTRSGTMTAIMGPSGAGKTTLLATISQRISGDLQGSICLNGRPVDKEMMLRMSGFVPQQDLAVPVLTVREHLWFMASLKMDRRVSRMQRLRSINSLILELGLTRSAHTRLGALSGGEGKRLALAVQMLTDPPILFCDEVTTGLDSHTAGTVVGVLRQLATTRGKAILCSIHQPASGVFEQFDTVTLLLPGGSLAYHGDVISAKSYFESLGIICPPAYNPAEFIVNQLNREQTHDAICEKFALSSAHAELDKELEVERETSTNLDFVYGIEEKFIKFYSV